VNAIVELSIEEMEALRREASGQSVLAHVQLEDDAEAFWAVLSNKLEHALREAKRFGTPSQPVPSTNGGTS
jgi:hypothetical protein